MLLEADRALDTPGAHVINTAAQALPMSAEQESSGVEPENLM